MVRDGKFSIAQAAGPLAGEYDVVVTDMGAVQPSPTVADSRILPGTQTVVVSDTDLKLDLNYTE
jgi:hypothetical protein